MKKNAGYQPQYTYRDDPERAYVISDARRREYQRTAVAAHEAKKRAMLGDGPPPVHVINTPRLYPALLMPQMEAHGLSALSLFSGGGGLDLGFERAGFAHVAAYDKLLICGETLRHNRPSWQVFSGPEAGDVRGVDWTTYRGTVDVVHGGPPCQPFSIAGRQKGKDDDRNMWGAFANAVNQIKPAAFVAENVLGLLNPKFASFVEQEILAPLSDYRVRIFEMNAPDYGVPQVRRRVLIVGFRAEAPARRFVVPAPTHSWRHLQRGGQVATPHAGVEGELPLTMGARQALGLAENGYDAVAPTLRSGFTGKRMTTSVLSSKAAERAWAKLGIWGNGVQASRERAHQFVAKNGHFRLSVQDCAVLQGFPADWVFKGPVYKVLGQLGNSVVPVVGYHVAAATAQALLGCEPV